MTAKGFMLPDLPINACLDELSSALQSGYVILSAATGSGNKSMGVHDLTDKSMGVHDLPQMEVIAC